VHELVIKTEYNNMHGERKRLIRIIYINHNYLFSLLALMTVCKIFLC